MNNDTKYTLDDLGEVLRVLKDKGQYSCSPNIDKLIYVANHGKEDKWYSIDGAYITKGFANEFLKQMDKRFKERLKQ